MDHAVELENVTKTFGKKVAVDRLDLTVPRGTIYGFIGPNGSGKTTALRLMLRIYRPESGRVVVLGSDRGSVADDRLGYLPEERGLYKRMKVGPLIEYFARLKGFRDCRKAAGEWLERLGASQWADQKVQSLSKGMAQKIQFIVAVIARPELLVLDEPFAGLDPVNLDVLREAVQTLRESGTTIVFSTHDMNVAEEMCDMIFMIFEGKKVLDGSLAEIQRSHPVRRVRLRLADRTLPADLPGVVAVSSDHGSHLLELAAEAEPQAILRAVSSYAVEHFEVVKPTLHDIFVRIARPQESHGEADR